MRASPTYRLLCAALLACACHASPDVPPVPKTEDLSDDGLHPGDVIAVSIFREPEFSGQFPVDATGRVVLPRLGPVDASGKTAAVLRAEIETEYARFFKTPSIQVSVLRRISVQGAVRSPGLYPVDATVSLSDVIAIAGGITPNGDSKKIRLVRQGQVLGDELTPDMIVERSPLRSGDQLFIEEKPWLARNSGVIVAALISAVALLVATTLP